MTYLLLGVLGLALGSFVNALVWRIHEQSNSRKKTTRDLSIMKGRSMCPHCKHQLSATDLLPVLSWVYLGGKCRYCKKPISRQYPIVELATAALFILSYAFWPSEVKDAGLFDFIVWLPVLVGLVALLVYDLWWMLLPNRIVYPLLVFVLLAALVRVAIFGDLSSLGEVGLGLLVGGGIFYVLFQVSKGKWIGGGDVKLGAVLGVIVASPVYSLMFIFVASFLGTLITLPLLIAKKTNMSSRIPFGPFLIVGAIIVKLFGAAILEWYKRTFLPV